ncbi:MAG: VWA domain-containing protein [Promethearchaeota archaeon]
MKPPFVNISQSILKGPPQKKYSLIFKTKILPECTDATYPFFGVYLLDTSESMSGSKLESAKDSLVEQTISLPMGSIFSLITFGPVRVMADNIEINPKSKNEIIGIIEKLSTTCATLLKSALTMGITLLKNYKGALPSRIITLITDGYGILNRTKFRRLQPRFSN